MYIVVEILSITRQIELIEKNEVAIATFNLENKTFVVYIASLTISNVHSFYKAQIALLKANKAFITIFLEYSNFADIFSLELAAKFLKYIRINNHAINLMNSNQLYYESIYNLGPIELKILKIILKPI